MFFVAQNPPICGRNVDNIRKYGKLALYLRRNSNTTAKFPTAYTLSRTSLQDSGSQIADLILLTSHNPDQATKTKLS